LSRPGPNSTECDLAQNEVEAIIDWKTCLIRCQGHK
jgi:hypothetical protein